MNAFILIAAPLSAGLAQAHSGGSDKQGCDVDRKTDIRHCH